MSHKAYSILENSNFMTKNLYQLIDSYFDSPTLEKIQDKDKISIYMCKIKTLLASPEQRYLIATTSIDNNPIGKKISLENINWNSFQTRTLSNVNQNVISHSYSPKNSQEYMLKVYVSNRYEDHTDYKLNDINCTITLIHKNKNLYEYPSSGTLPACLETYKTVIVI